MNNNPTTWKRRRSMPWLMLGAVLLLGFIGLIIGSAVGVASPAGSPANLGAIGFTTAWVIAGLFIAPGALVWAILWARAIKPPVTLESRAAKQAQHAERTAAKQAQKEQARATQTTKAQAKIDARAAAQAAAVEIRSTTPSPRPKPAVSSTPVAAAPTVATPKRKPFTRRPELDYPHYQLLAGNFANYEVVGEHYRQDSVIKALGGLVLNVERTLEDVISYLIPEPENRHGKGSAVMVWMNGHHVGYLAHEDAVRYRPVLDRIVAAGYLPVTTGRLWGISRFNEWDRKTKHHLYARVALNEPELLIPTNQPPLGNYSLLPWGTAIQVTKEADHLPELTEHLHGPDSFAIATLRSASRTLKNGTVRDFVTVHLDGDEIGELTPGMSEKVLPMIHHLNDLDLEAAAWARVKGSVLAIEVTLQVARAHEAPDAWLTSIPVTTPSLSPIPVANTDDTVEAANTVRDREGSWDF